MFRSLHARLWLSYAAVIVTALAVVGLVLAIFLLRNPLLYRKTYLRLTAAEAVLATQPQGAVVLPQVAEELDVRAMVFSREGQLMADSGVAQPGISLPPNPLNLRTSGTLRD